MDEDSDNLWHFQVDGKLAHELEIPTIGFLEWPPGTCKACFAWWFVNVKDKLDRKEST